MHRIRRWICLGLLLAFWALPAPLMAEDAGKTTARAVLSFAGDCTLGSTKESQKSAGGFVQLIAELGMEHPFSGVKHIFEADDLTLVNLEGTFTNETKSLDKAYLFKAPPSYAAILPLGSVEAVNIANNHTGDFLAQGREDTIAALEAQQVLYSGNGALATYDANGILIGMTGYSYPHDRTPEYLERDIAALRAMGCDIVIVSMHAGTEEHYRLTGTQKDVAHSAISLGADIVVGHHPHIVHGVEIYQGKPIFYSLGNFSFGGNNNPKDWDTMIGQVVVEKDADGVRLVEMRIIPCLISGAERRNDYRPVVAEGERAQSIMTKIRRYSVNVDDRLFTTGSLSLLEDTP